MHDLYQLFHSYSIKKEHTIKRICAPLVDCLNIPIFTYSFLEADGRFGYITNTLEFNEYYFSEKLYLQNPYFAHPALFRSGHVLAPCSIDAEIQKSLRKKYRADHFFLSVYTTATRMECFIFANENMALGDFNPYFSRLDLLTKFCRYFKREAKGICQSMYDDHFSMLEGRESTFFAPPDVPLSQADGKMVSFMKAISGLTPQEMRCLDLFKEGKTAQATAAILGLSRRTVEHYFENIKDKLGCSSKFDLLNY